MEPLKNFPVSAEKVYRKQLIEGVIIPGIIRNGRYFFTDLHVYEDGRVDCWNFEDFDHFVKDVQREWIAVNVPDGKEISVHDLGIWAIEKGDWVFNKDSFVDYVRSALKSLNPQLENIYKYTQKTRNGVRIGESGRGILYKEHKRFEKDIFPQRITGENVNLFYNDAGIYKLAGVNVFADGTITLSRLETPLSMSMAEFDQLASEGKIVSEPPLSSRVSVYGLGSFTIQRALWTVDLSQKLLEIKDVLKKLKGEPTTIEICRKALALYYENPVSENRDKLKAAYENIPDHHKSYVGDMDTKDFEVREIIYGPDFD